MRIITKTRLRDYWGEHPEAENSLTGWYRTVKSANWRTFADVKGTFRSADVVGKCIVFNVGGNNIRVIAAVHYQEPMDDDKYTLGKVFIRKVMTHAEYDRNRWKDECGC